MIENIYELEWTDTTISTTFSVCPGCHSEMMLAVENTDGTTEWHCPECWNAFSGDGNRIGAVNFGGGISAKCPECGDRRIARDPYSGHRYCKGCRTTYYDLKTEAVLNQAGEIVGGRVTDYGEPDYAQACPNCGQPLRVQIFDLPDGSAGEGYTCHHCDLTYRRDDNGLLVPFPECPRCGGRSLVRHGDIRKCRFCGVKTNLENQYLNPDDAPKDEGEKSEVHSSSYEHNYQA